MSDPIKFISPDPSNLPDVVLTAAGNPAQAQLFTSDNVAWVLDELGIALRYDVMRHQAVFLHPAFGLGERDQECLYQLLCDMLTRARIKNLGALGDVLGVLARRDRFHPVADWINASEWDGADHFAQLVGTVPTDSAMWPVYLRKFMVQVCEAIFGWRDEQERSLAHVLVFVGGQGLGKGRWLRHLLPHGWVLADAELHLNTGSSKDHQLSILQYPIVELGEIDATFRKSDVSAMKAFLSRAKDVIREPYARRAVSHLRGTCFTGSVNDVQFLNDPSGTRRFWPVQVTGKLTWDHGIDLQQLWAQAASWWEDNEDWNLSEAQDAARVEASRDFVMASPEVEMVATLFHEHGERWGEYVLAKASQIAQLIGYSKPTRATTAAISQYMNERAGHHRTLVDEKGKEHYRVWAVPGGARPHLVAGLGSLAETNAKQYVRWT